MKLVAYFSTSGKTEAEAKKIAEREDADIFVIQPAEPYTGADLDWQERGCRANNEMENKSNRVALAATCEDIAKYDEIYLGFPLWWGYAPRIINTFLESADFTGKKIIPFVTSGGSEYTQDTAEDLKKCAPGAIFEEGTRIK
jgi:putative NADPH-quinone reductase